MQDTPSDAYVPSSPLKGESRVPRGGKAESVAAAAGAMPGFPLQLILVGPDGAGKTTQSKKLAEDFNLKLLHVDQLVEKESESGSSLARSVNWYESRGMEIPSRVVYQVLDSQLSDFEGGYILDGLPGAGLQEEMLVNLLEKEKFAHLQVVGIEVGSDSLSQRLNLDGEVCQAEYQDKSQEQLDFFINEGRYSVVDGDGTVEEVEQRLHECLSWLQPRA